MIPDLAETVPPDCPDGTLPNAAGDACEMTLGTHTFTVAAVDIDGNVDLTPASITWTVLEGTPPETRIDSGPGHATTSTDASFDFSANETGVTFRCSLDGASFSACVSPAEYSDLAIGDHQFRVVATDSDGLVDATPAFYTWTIGEPDAEAPETRIEVGPDAVTNHRDAAFAFSASEPGAIYACSLNGGAWIDCASPDRLHGPPGRRAHVRRAGYGPVRERRPDAGDLHMDGRPRRAKHHHHRQAGRPEPRRVRELRSAGQRQHLGGRVDRLPVQAR